MYVFSLSRLITQILLNLCICFGLMLMDAPTWVMFISALTLGFLYPTIRKVDIPKENKDGKL